MTLWVDVTTSLNWNRPALGVVRVELEIISRLINEKSNARYFYFNAELKRCFELNEENVRSMLDRIVMWDENKKPEIHETNETNETNEISDTGRKFFFNFRKHEARHYFYHALRNLYFLSLSFVHLDYHLKIRKEVNNKFNLVKMKLKKSLGYLRKGDDANAKEDAQCLSPQYNDALIFKINDKILALGAIWNYSEINVIFLELKYKFNVKIYSISFDLIPISHAHLCLSNVSERFQKLYHDICWYSEHVFCISKQTELDLIDFQRESGVPLVNKSVITLGCDLYSGLDEDIEINDVILSLGSYVLFVSTIEARKNHHLLYQVVCNWLENGITDFPTMVFVGMKGWGVDDLINNIEADARIRGKIIILNHISDVGLSSIYKNSLFTVYPSYYEGWGLPITESLGYGKFCISSNTSSMPEAGFGFSELISPYDIQKWSDRILFYYQNQNELKIKEEKIKQEFLIPTWEKTVKSIMTVVNE